MLTNSEVEELLGGMTIRRIRKSELSQLFKLTGKAFEKEALITGLNVDRLSRVAKLYDLIDLLLPIFDVLRKDFETILVAVSGNKLIGEIHLSPQGKEIWSVASSAVDPMFRRRGIFKKLVREALRYVSKKHGKRVVLSVRTDNVPAVRVYNELGFEIFDRMLLLRSELDEIPSGDFDGDISAREVTSSDVERIYEICRALGPRRIETYKIEPADFLDSFLSYMKRRIAWSYSKRWVIEVKGGIVGYTHFTFTPPQEAAKIESFYVRPSSNSSKLTSFLLSEVLSFLVARNIGKVTTSLREERREAIEIFEHFGFKPLVTFYEMVKELV